MDFQLTPFRWPALCLVPVDTGPHKQDVAKHRRYPGDARVDGADSPAGREPACRPPASDRIHRQKCGCGTPAQGRKANRKPTGSSIAASTAIALARPECAAHAMTLVGRIHRIRTAAYAAKATSGAIRGFQR